jgi:predicted S18 family serine protease
MPNLLTSYENQNPHPTGGKCGKLAQSYLFDGNAHVYLPDAIGQLEDGSLFIAEAGMEREKQKARNQAKACAARKLAAAQGRIYWIGTEATLLPKRHANLVFSRNWSTPFARVMVGNASGLFIFYRT